jgi:hypothetical protein
MLDFAGHIIGLCRSGPAGNIVSTRHGHKGGRDRRAVLAENSAGTKKLDRGSAAAEPVYVSIDLRQSAQEN